MHTISSDRRRRISISYARLAAFRLMKAPQHTVGKFNRQLVLQSTCVLDGLECLRGYFCHRGWSVFLHNQARGNRMGKSLQGGFPRGVAGSGRSFCAIGWLHRGRGLEHFR